MNIPADAFPLQQATQAADVELHRLRLVGMPRLDEIDKRLREYRQRWSCLRRYR